MRVALKLNTYLVSLPVITTFLLAIAFPGLITDVPESRGWTVISMKEHFVTVYGEEIDQA